MNVGEGVVDEPDEPASVSDGIYSTCPVCFVIVAHQAGHTAWHASRGEVEPDAHD